jgi:RNA polymerase sigma-70 factor, ECF subfamily
VQGQPATEAVERTLAQNYWERLRVFGIRRLGDPALAEDLAQETLRRVGEALRSGRLEDLAALPAFVFQTAANVCLHHYRSRGREERALARVAGMGSAVSPRGPLDALIGKESRAAVRAALGRLDPGDQDLLRRIFFVEEPSADTARALGVTPGALRVRKHRALERLAGFLREWRV